MRASHGDRGEVDIIGPSEGLVASSILAGRTRTPRSRLSRRVVASGNSSAFAHELPNVLHAQELPEASLTEPALGLRFSFLGQL